MSTSRSRALLAATLLAAAALLVTAGPAEADPTPTPTPTPTATAEPPGAPSDLRVTGITPGSVTLSWNPSTGGCCALAGYQISYSRAFNDVFWSQSVGNVTTATITSSIGATGQYSFSVHAVDVDGHRSASTNSVTVVTPAGTTGDTTPPAAPTGLQVTGVTPAGTALSWNPSTDDVAVTGYQVYFFDGWYTSTLVGTTAGTSIVAAPTSSSTGMRYYYVRARDAAGNLSIASATVTGPATPTPTPTVTLPPPAACRVVYRSTSQWEGGFVAEVTVTNTGATPVDGWTLTFPFAGDQQVTSSWGATFSQAGIGVTLTGLPWNRTIQPGASVTAGLLGRWTTSNASPSSAALNGGSCTMA
jgi:hypothetical protein